MKVFKDEGLDITIKANLKSINLLDVEVDLATGEHRPYTMPNNTLLYIDVNSNHPVIRNTSPAVQRRISTLSFNEEIFKQAIPPYQEALDNADHKRTLVYEKYTSKHKQTTSRRKITWLNPPNIGAMFNRPGVAGAGLHTAS